MSVRATNRRSAPWFDRELGHDGVRAVWHAIASQITRPHVRGRYSDRSAQIPRERILPASLPACERRLSLSFDNRLPLRERKALPRWRGRRFCVRLEVQKPRLRPVVDFHFQRVVILPRDVQAHRHPHDSGSAVGAALFSLRDIFRWIPRFGIRCPAGVTGRLETSPFGGVIIRQRQSSVTTATQ